MKAMDVAGWEKMYRTGERGAEDAPTLPLLETIEKLRPGAAIDLACGTGRNALFLAEQGWTVTAVDASESAIKKLQERAAERGLHVNVQVADLTAPDFVLPNSAFDLIVIAYYLQRDLFAELGPALRAGGVVLAIVHIPEHGEQMTEKRASAGELRRFFEGWQIVHYYEGPSRDPAHRRPVAEIVARRSRRAQKWVVTVFDTLVRPSSRTQHAERPLCRSTDRLRRRRDLLRSRVRLSRPFCLTEAPRLLRTCR